tara:strand:+ start:971 stop:1165 length:195 start_codon:yes stop_codon:yes gene_type:complete
VNPQSAWKRETRNRIVFRNLYSPSFILMASINYSQPKNGFSVHSVNKPTTYIKNAAKGKFQKNE